MADGMMFDPIGLVSTDDSRSKQCINFIHRFPLGFYDCRIEAVGGLNDLRQLPQSVRVEEKHRGLIARTFEDFIYQSRVAFCERCDTEHDNVVTRLFAANG